MTIRITSRTIWSEVDEPVKLAALPHAHGLRAVPGSMPIKFVARSPLGFEPWLERLTVGGDQASARWSRGDWS